jgi:cell division control protein 6
MRLTFKHLYIFLRIPRYTKDNLIRLTQEVERRKKTNYESVKSSLQLDHIVFHEHSMKEFRDILRMRAKEGSNKYAKESLGLLSTRLFRDCGNEA